MDKSSPASNSYGRQDKVWPTTYRDIIGITTRSKIFTIRWCQEHQLLKKKQDCPQCSEKMTMVSSHVNDGYIWVCKKTIDGKRHQVKKSVRADSWFFGSNLTLGEIIETTYLWTRNVSQDNIRHEMKIGEHTGVR